MLSVDASSKTEDLDNWDITVGAITVEDEKLTGDCLNWSYNENIFIYNITVQQLLLVAADQYEFTLIPEQFTVKAHPALFMGRG